MKTKFNNFIKLNEVTSSENDIFEEIQERWGEEDNQILEDAIGRKFEIELKENGKSGVTLKGGYLVLFVDKNTIKLSNADFFFAIERGDVINVNNDEKNDKIFIELKTGMCTLTAKPMEEGNQFLGMNENTSVYTKFESFLENYADMATTKTDADYDELKRDAKQFNFDVRINNMKKKLPDPMTVTFDRGDIILDDNKQDKYHITMEDGYRIIIEDRNIKSITKTADTYTITPYHNTDDTYFFTVIYDHI